MDIVPALCQKEMLELSIVHSALGAHKGRETITRPLTFVVLAFVGTFISEGLCEVGMRVS